MLRNRVVRIGLPVLALMAGLLATGCTDLSKRFTLLMHGTYEVPTPYITPVARGAPAAFITPFAHETPAFLRETCATIAGKTHFTKAQAFYQVFGVLKGSAAKASREDLPPIIDEMRQVHGKFEALEAPAKCEIFVVIDTHIEAEMDQTIRAYVAFRNLEPQDTVMDYLNEALLHSKKVQELLGQVE